MREQKVHCQRPSRLPGLIKTARLFLLLWAAATAWVQGEDWPTFQHDNHRSARSSENLPAARLSQQWVYQSPQPPQPAWGGAAKWDAYAGIRGLKSMRNYDPVFHVIVVGQSLFFGSSVDDAVHCLDTRTGQEKWTFTTDGAVRIAPAYWNGRLFFGSDDSQAYCLNADDGALLWKFRPVPADRLILHNGRFIPFWPCRTGVMVEGGNAYFATGMLPWKESYLCAVDAMTGHVAPVKSGQFIKKLESVTLEGALLASGTKLISPQGRVAPLLFNRKDGTPLGGLEGGGGCFVLLTEDARVLHGPGNKSGWIQESSEKDRSKIATFNGGNALVVQSNTAYLLTDSALLALNRTSRKEIWQQPSDCPDALIMAGDVLYTGGTDKVTAFNAADGKPLWRSAVAGRAYGLAVANGALFASTDQGAIHCFRASEGTPPPALADSKSPAALAEKTVPLQLATGPCLKFGGPDRAVVWWQTAQPMPTMLEWGLQDDLLQRFEDAAPKTDHTATLTGLRHDRTYYYAIKGASGGKPATTEKFECDTVFNYSLPAVPEETSLYASDGAASLYREAAKEILAQSGVTQGICLVLGCGNGQMAYELAKHSSLRIVGVDTDPGKVRAARQALKPTGIYGARIAIHHVASLSKLPFTGLFANLIVSDRMLAAAEFPASAAAIAEYLRPNGGVALLGQPSDAPQRLDESQMKAWLDGVSTMAGLTGQVRGHWAKIVRGGALPGAGEWSHEYGTAANAAYGGESLQGARSTDDLEVQWLGHPGPRAQADRNGRKPSPLATNGRLFVQGLRRIIALDAFNGTILWSREIPPLERFNMPRDCSNWCADNDSVYLAIRDQCWRLDAASGELAKLYPAMPGSREGWQYDWSYLSVQGDKLIGSAVKKGTAYTEFWGDASAGWYDATSGPATFKVCSENLFALDQQTGRKMWRYTGGMIINSTISIAGDRIFFLESRHPKVKASDSHRIGMPELWQDQYLVALDLAQGSQVWEKLVKPAAGEVVVYLACGQGKLVLVTSGDKKYHVYAFDGVGGNPLWQSQFPWDKDNHGAHMARPAIVGHNVYVRPKVFDLLTGQVRAETIPGGGCGTYAATDKALFFRNSNVTVWDVENGQTTSWERLRPDCWLSTIPADGLLLSPEAGGGCSCGSWMETSLAFIPKNRE